jgi:two-component system sensor histidine kinase VanS
VAEEAAETLLPLAEKHGVTVQTSGDIAPTIGSHALLLQMTTNLLHNAIVHNLPERGTVQVDTAIRTGAVMLTVENTGAKLTPKQISTLTKPFQRVTERIRTDHAGVGLGLAIVKSIIEAHDGTLAIVPRPDGGIRVTAQLPAEIRNLNGASGDPHVRSQHQNVRISKRVDRGNDTATIPVPGSYFVSQINKDNVGIDARVL